MSRLSRSLNRRSPKMNFSEYETNETMNETLKEWLERFNPDHEEATEKLCIMILKEKAKDEDLATLAEYIQEFYQDEDPRSMGWVGNDGLP